MTQSILIFDFGSNEDAAQQARHKLEGWTQAFRLGKKILLKFDRQASAEDAGKDGSAAAGEGKSSPKKSVAKAAGKPTGSKEAKSKDAESKDAPSKDRKNPATSAVQLLVRLDFSGHEKLSHQRWLDRIPSEEPFKSARTEIIHHADPAFAGATERFDSLA